jgi:hypothetical protein
MLYPELTTPEQLSESNDGAVVTYAARTDVVAVVAVTPLPPNDNSVLLLPTHRHSPCCPPPNSITAAATIAVVATGAQTAVTAIHTVGWQRGINDVALVGVLYALGADRGDHKSGEKDSGTESHGK